MVMCLGLPRSEQGIRRAGRNWAKARRIQREGLRGVALGKGKDSFEAIPEILACRATGDQSWDAEVPQIPQTTCLVEVFKERASPVAGQEIHEIARYAVQAIEDTSARGRSCRSSCGGRCMRCVVLWWGESGRGGGGCSSAGCHRARGSGSVGRRGGIEVEGL
jgi:hypothetical protein